jgi:CRISPR-associated protein Csb2
MGRHLVLTIRFHDRRYHGVSEWPPSPARLFQALVAGIARGNVLPGWATASFRWLESLPSPVIAVPHARVGRSVDLFVPNNDSDAVGGDPARIGEIRIKKAVRPRLLEDGTPLMYAWPLADETEHASKVIDAAADLYQFGRGVDPAWAVGELVDDETLAMRLTGHPGTIYRPGHGEGGKALSCPAPGTLESLIRRYVAGAAKIRIDGDGKATRTLFSQPPKPRFIPVIYGSSGHRLIYELRTPSSESSFAPWPLSGASSLVVCLRDGAVARLNKALPDRRAEIARVLVGRQPDGTNAGAAAERVRIVPLPSIGHSHADRAIRRVLVEVPPGCPLRGDDVGWAFSGLEPVETGEVRSVVLTPAVDDSMLRHYGIGDGVTARVWRTLTPIALPESRRRIEPTRLAAESKGGAERVQEQERATAAIVQALRHAEVSQRALAIRVQREPFERHGRRVEVFAPGTRFPKERLWHVEIVFGEPVAGPLIVGDGRFLGLGVLAPVRQAHGIHAFIIEDGLIADPTPQDVARDLRRAVMSRAQQLLDSRLPSFFAGHESDGGPSKAERSHLTFVFDPRARRLLVVAPHLLDRRAPTNEEARHLDVLDRALAGFRELRAGQAGVLALRPVAIDEHADPLVAPFRTWETVTPYLVTRHQKGIGASEALAADVRIECRRRALPDPVVSVLGVRGIPGVGVSGSLRLDFRVAVRGPISLGRDRHFGGGLFSGSLKDRDLS